MQGLRRIFFFGSDRTSDGFVQVLVLISLATISAILQVILSNSVQLSSSLKALDRSVLGQTAASSAARRVIAAIEDPSDDLETKILAAGTPYPVEIAGTKVEVSIEGEGGKIDPATADQSIIAGYLAPLTLSGDQRSGLMAQLAEARANKSPAAAIGALYRFLVSIVSSDQLRRDFTDLDTTTGIDPMFADDRVLAAIPDIGAGKMAAIKSLRRDNPAGLNGMSAYFTSGQPIFTIVATVHWSATEQYSMGVPIEISTAGQVIALDGFM